MSPLEPSRGLAVLEHRRVDGEFCEFCELFSAHSESQGIFDQQS